MTPELRAYIEQAVAQAPPLTPDVLDRLRRILAPERPDEIPSPD